MVYIEKCNMDDIGITRYINTKKVGTQKNALGLSRNRHQHYAAAVRFI